MSKYLVMGMIQIHYHIIATFTNVKVIVHYKIYQGQDIVNDSRLSFWWHSHYDVTFDLIIYSCFKTALKDLCRKNEYFDSIY